MRLLFSSFLKNGNRFRTVVSPFLFRKAAHSSIAHDIGHIPLGKNESLIFLDNLVNTPTFLNIQRYAAFLFQKNLRNQIQRAFPSSPSFHLEDVIFRWQDGGAFLKVRYAETDEDTEKMYAIIRDAFKERPVTSLLHPFSRPTPHIVYGRPWLQDLYAFPARTIELNFEGPSLSQEKLYSIFRKYGKLRSVEVVSPEGAILKFTSLRAATSALNCMHGFRMNDTKFHMRYRHTNRFLSIKDWLVSHPRFAIPLIAALITVITASLFDPMRRFFVETNIVHGQTLRNIKLFSWIKKTRDIVFKPFQDSDLEITPIWTTREKDCQKLEEWLDEALHSFIVVQGPRGSGKRDLVDRAVGNRKHVLVFDCDRLFSGANEGMFVSSLASQTGYFPLFSFLNNLSSMIDMAAQGLIGQKTGIVSSAEGQVRQILSTTQTVLRKLALDEHKDSEHSNVLDESEYLEVHADKLPVVVLDNFQLRKLNNPMQHMVAEWAGNLVKEGVVHVLMLTPDVGGTKTLEQYVGGWENRTLLLGDADPLLAQRYVLDSIPKEIRTERLEKELKKQLPKIGGRLRDLDYVARRLRVNNSSVSDAIGGIISQNTSDILQSFLRSNSLSFGDDKKPLYTSEQAWILITLLSQHEHIPYHKLMLDPLLKGHDDAVRALEEDELITITSVNARPDKVFAGKPVYVTAFQQLVNDSILRAAMSQARCNAIIRLCNSAIRTDEEELQLLKGLGNFESGMKERARYLLARIKKNQGVIEENEKLGERFTAELNSNE
ncbi:RNA-binding protein [Schizosaccharomyces cryophilus OY26]|uniref:Mitochondrial escape protein 2 n=1 Tax=Schizosaccharomyces cryophilus (strain OY26 / ATCC MYA-4695 / CBS 11777 / NBRC 106824 / NRRL Y48691) TaxID=653667 RepID=S9VML8_SCHCR|nr:RNA-binding protein [Schizosaccharomyces cryophilus OY26]EPY49203.1 RNA-binding protein [Schizosaccharomyces cryophilus OY26]